MDINELNKLYFRYRREGLDDFSTSTLIIAQRQRIEELEEELANYSARAVSMNNVVAGDIVISNVKAGRR